MAERLVGVDVGGTKVALAVLDGSSLSDPVVVPTADQRRAIVVCSSVRRELSVLPRSFTSLRSSAYRALVSDGGGGGRNCVAESTAIGATYWR